MKTTLIGTAGVVFALAAIFAGTAVSDAMATEPRVCMTAGIAGSHHATEALRAGCIEQGDECPVLAGNGKGRGGSGSGGNGKRDGSGKQNRRGQGGGNGTGTCRQ